MHAPLWWLDGYGGVCEAHTLLRRPCSLPRDLVLAPELAVANLATLWRVLEAALFKVVLCAHGEDKLLTAVNTDQDTVLAIILRHTLPLEQSELHVPRVPSRKVTAAADPQRSAIGRVIGPIHGPS